MGVRVREKPKGSGDWWIFINHQGWRKSKKVGKDKKLANEIARKIKARLILGDQNVMNEKEAPPTFDELAKQWLAMHVKPSKRSTTYNRYSSMLRMYLKKPLGNIPIDELKRSDILKAFRQIHSKGLSRSTVETARNVVSGVCEFAIDYELITYNPCAGIMKRMGMQRKLHKKPIVVFSKDEVGLILQTCQKLRPDYYPLFLTAFRTGMRLGEILALKWENVNWNRSYIVIQESFRNGKLTSTKTGKARNVEMSNQLYSTLRELYRKRKEEALKAGTNEVEPIIFHTKGDYTSQNSARNVWKRLLTKSELDYRKLHCIRHTFASLLIADGHSLTYIKDAMGHSSIQITVDVYGHLIPSDDKGAVNTLDDAPKTTPSAPSENKEAVTPEDYGQFLSMVAMQGFALSKSIETK